MPKTAIKPSIAELRELVVVFNELSTHKEELSEVLGKIEHDVFKQLCPEPRWAVFYELPFPEHLILSLHLMRVLPLIHQATQAEKPLSALLDTIKHNDAEATLLPVLKSSTDTEKRLFWTALMSLLYSIESVALCKRSLNSLVKDARNGDMDAYQIAVRVDRSCITSPALAHLITKSEWIDDKAAVNATRNALLKTLGNKKAYLRTLNFLLTALTEMGQLEHLRTATQRHDLFAKELGIYTRTEGSQESLHRYINNWQKTSRIPIEESESVHVAPRFHYVLSHVINDSRSTDTWQRKDTHQLLIDIGKIIRPDMFTTKAILIRLLKSLFKKRPVRP